MCDLHPTYVYNIHVKLFAVIIMWHTLILWITPKILRYNKTITRRSILGSDCTTIIAMLLEDCSQSALNAIKSAF